MSDEAFMRAALDRAAVLRGRTGVNPTVGCVIVKGGAVIASGATGAGGRPHAEEVACDAAGAAAQGATAYVTLEPCAQRSTGADSCTDRLIAAGVARVVIAVADPHPFADGAGIARLLAAEIDVEMGLLADEAAAMNAEFFERVANNPSPP